MQRQSLPYYFAALCSGAFVALMVALNGVVKTEHGTYTAAAIMYAAGLLTSIVVIAVRGKWQLPKGVSPFFFFGGVCGVFTTVFNNLAFGVISVSAILALSLFGQSVGSLLIDTFGLFGMPKRPIDRGKLVGFALVLAGIVVILVS